MYLDSRPMIEGITRRWVLRSKFMVVSGILKIGIISVWVRKQFCWIFCFTVVVYVDWIRPCGMKRILESDGEIGFKTGDLIKNISTE